MRIRPRHTLIFIIILTIVSGWLTLPSDVLNIGGVKDNVFVHQGLDLQGGLQVTLQANPPAGTKIDKGSLDGTRDTISRRVNGLGVSEPLVQTRGNNQIIVELPGVKDPEEAISVLQETALLEIIDPQGQFLPKGTVVTTSLGGPESLKNNGAATPEASPVGSPGASPVASPGATPAATPGATPVAGSTEASATATPTGPVYTTIISGKDLADAFPTTGNFGQAVVGFRLKGSAADKFFQFTSTHIGQPMSIVLDKTVISSPQINGAISDQGIIEGMPANEVNNLVIQLKAGALAVPLEVVQSRTVGPQLGQDSIDRSLLAGIIGLATVALFMIIYYRVPGAISVVALLIYTCITFALFKLIPVTLTLAGIAGFILSIGMAVDANVLIFARMKEELRTGRTLANSVEAGFDHAWPSIRDSNISSMITCVILYWFGRYTGASIITGFALTLFVGVAVSMFTAIIVTRTFLRVMIFAGLGHHGWWFGIHEHPEIAAAGD
ncbi:MAG TPA: protein translocase subunit SecD [Thermomicrobiales bacterium]|nr:protein translocase subunit SecD [Thermomicrobiales bacterium]